MHRLYAVPSEKLRVWSIWLSQITDEAEIWQKWLRSHIDLIIRMTERLKVLEQEEDVSSMPRKLWSDNQVGRIFAYEEDAIENDGIEYPEGVEDFYDSKIPIYFGDKRRFYSINLGGEMATISAALSSSSSSSSYTSFCYFVFFSFPHRFYLSTVEVYLLWFQ
ncbi:hypothetical protein M0802_013422 [Mischocyttarus mexicanus]|nr:hypothetical protein M0802_013422 [Mischocyttarus mexicanus]